MKPSSNQSIYAGSRFVTAAALVLTLVFAPGAVLAKDRVAHEDRAEYRIKELHTKLKITSAQEELWTKIEQAMREDAKTMDRLTQARVEHAKEMTAVDDLKSYGEIAEAHANGIKNLTPLFAALYDSMSDAQKKEADALFRHGGHKHGEHKHGHKMSAAE